MRENEKYRARERKNGVKDPLERPQRRALLLEAQVPKRTIGRNPRTQYNLLNFHLVNLFKTQINVF